MFGLNLGNLDVGTNTITGTKDKRSVDSGDAFAVNLGAGLTLVSVTAQISNYAANSNGERFRDGGGLFNIVFSSNVLITLPAATLASLQALPSFGLAMLDSVSGNNESWDYTITIITSGAVSVPEPSTLGLLAAGLLGLAFARRKKAA